jgi:hypothetical protein
MIVEGRDDRTASGTGRGALLRIVSGVWFQISSATQARPMSAQLIGVVAVIALGIAAAIAWDTFCLRDLIRADPARVRYLPKWGWAAVCLISCPWGGLLYMIVGRGPAGRSQPPGGTIPG